MNVRELSAYLQGLSDKVATRGPEAAVWAMAETYRRYVQKVTLRRFAHSPGTWTTSPPGGTPAWVNGDLARSIKSRQGNRTAYTASAGVGPYIIYGRIQEKGGDIWHRRANWLHWQNIDPRTGQLTDWYRKHVYIPPRPYLEPSARDTIADGSLSRSAAAAFMAAVWE